MNGKKRYFIKCPLCHKSTSIKIYKDTVLLNFPILCSHCDTESIVNVVSLKMTISNDRK